MAMNRSAWRLKRLLVYLVCLSVFAIAQGVQSPTSPVKAGDKVPMIVVTLRPHGFEPDKITLSQNTVILYIINRAGGKGDPDMTIAPNTTANGNANANANVQAYSGKASQNGLDMWRFLTISKGQYTMTMSNHGTAKLSIEVTK